ncbi:MAG TPA: ATP-binding protein [Anaeromyxobacter sp.]|nr:ATP-binding protein [Anaeromyxobacter sp.]
MWNEEQSRVAAALPPALAAGCETAFVCDEGGAILAASEAIGSRLGRRREALVGTALAELAIPRDRRAVRRALASLRERAPVPSFTFRLASRHGPPVEARIGAWSAAAGGAPLTLCVVSWNRRRSAEERARMLADTQRTIASVLALALEDVPLEDLLERTLDLILGIPWLSIERKGAVFLVDEAEGALVMKASRGMHPVVLSACARVPIGSCMCGRAALLAAPVHSDHVDERHTTRYPGLVEHGHYCVPIRSDARVMGVLTAYLAPGHARSDVELEFLSAVANGLAGVLARRRADAERRRAEDASRRKSEFLALVSHELLTPVTAVMLSCERLERDRSVPLAPRHAEILSRMEGALGRLASTIRLLLEHARLETARPLARRDVVDLAALARSVVEEVRPAAERKGLAARFALDPPIPTVLTDERLLRIVLLNLATNAVKFTQAGSVSVRVGYGGGAHRVAVEDTGPGIPEPERQRIFDGFEPLEPLANKHLPGMGLGLPLARRLAEALGARLELGASGRSGSTFLVTLPGAPAPAGAERAARSAGGA